MCSRLQFKATGIYTLGSPTELNMTFFLIAMYRIMLLGCKPMYNYLEVSPTEIFGTYVWANMDVLPTSEFQLRYQLIK